MKNRYRKELDDRAKAHLIRTLPTQNAAIDFYSNDYLGLARSEGLYQAIGHAYKELESKSNGSTGSRLLSGNSSYVESLESKIASFHSTDSAVLFSTGYAANIGLISALGKRETTIISDQLVHASMIDGVRLSHAKRLRFLHNDLDDLTVKLDTTDGDKIVLVEAIYSMDGDRAPLEDILEVCNEYDAQLIVDEAHSVGVAGIHGQGLCSQLGIQKEVLATIVTYGKGFGVHGAAVLGATWLKEYLVNFARSFIYSTAPSNHQLVSIDCSYDSIKQSKAERKQLKENIQYFSNKREECIDLHWLCSDTAIQSLMVPGNESVMKAANTLNENGIAILPIRSPTVAPGTERLRVSLHSFNTRSEIDQFFEIISSWQGKR